MTDDIANIVLQVISKTIGMGVREITMESRVLHDLGLDGDDAIEAIQEISRKCSMDISEFNFETYFRSEPTLLTLLWFLPSQRRNRLDKKQPLTVGALIAAARSGSLRP